MFITDEAAKMPIPSALGEHDSTYWAYVKQDFHAPWFYCGHLGCGPGSRSKVRPDVRICGEPAPPSRFGEMVLCSAHKKKQR